MYLREGAKLADAHAVLYSICVRAAKYALPRLLQCHS